MRDTEPQTAGGKVLWHFTMSLDGFVAGPNHEMDWMTGDLGPSGPDRGVCPDHRCRAGGPRRLGPLPGRQQRVRRRLGRTDLRAHPPPRGRDPADGVTFLNCGPAEAVRIGLAAAGGKNLEVFSPTIGRQLLELGLIDEIDLHIAPILLGQGIRLYDNPGGAPIRLHRVGEGDPTSAVNVRYRPATTAKIPTESVSGT